MNSIKNKNHIFFVRDMELRSSKRGRNTFNARKENDAKRWKIERSLEKPSEFADIVYEYAEQGIDSETMADVCSRGLDAFCKTRGGKVGLLSIVAVLKSLASDPRYSEVGALSLRRYLLCTFGIEDGDYIFSNCAECILDIIKMVCEKMIQNMSCYDKLYHATLVRIFHIFFEEVKLTSEIAETIFHAFIIGIEHGNVEQREMCIDGAIQAIMLYPNGGSYYEKWLLKILRTECQNDVFVIYEIAKLYLCYRYLDEKVAQEWEQLIRDRYEIPFEQHNEYLTIMWYICCAKPSGNDDIVFDIVNGMSFRNGQRIEGTGHVSEQLKKLFRISKMVLNEDKLRTVISVYKTLYNVGMCRTLWMNFLKLFIDEKICLDVTISLAFELLLICVNAKTADSIFYYISLYKSQKIFDDTESLISNLFEYQRNIFGTLLPVCRK